MGEAHRPKVIHRPKLKTPSMGKHFDPPFLKSRKDLKEHQAGKRSDISRGLIELLLQATHHVVKRSTNDIDEDCSGGYDHCGGYFPDCCEGFACWKPLTDWDRRYGFNRCWPNYFLPPKPEDPDQPNNEC